MLCAELLLPAVFDNLRRARKKDVFTCHARRRVRCSPEQRARRTNNRRSFFGCFSSLRARVRQNRFHLGRVGDDNGDDRASKESSAPKVPGSFFRFICRLFFFFFRRRYVPPEMMVPRKL